MSATAMTTPTQPEPPSLPMTKTEHDDYRRLNAFVARNLHIAEDWVRAVKQIRDRRLYRSRYEKFDDWLWKEHQIGRRRAEQQIAFIEMKDQLERTNCSHLPANEGQGRELMKAEPDVRPVIMEVATERGGGRTTAAELAYLRSLATKGMTAEELLARAEAESQQLRRREEREEADEAAKLAEKVRISLGAAGRAVAKLPDADVRAELKRDALRQVAAWN